MAPDGTQYTKQDFIADTRAHPLGFLSNYLDSIRIRFLGRVAIVHRSETFRRVDSARGRFVWTDVLEHRDGRWVIVAAHDLMLPLGPHPPGGSLRHPKP